MSSSVPAVLQTAMVTLKAVMVGTKQMTLSVFRQIESDELYGFRAPNRRKVWRTSRPSSYRCVGRQ